MPLYEYQCDSCGHRFEVIQKFSDPPVEACPVCPGTVHRLLSSPAIQFKGSGWYVTDYARKGGGSAASSPAGNASRAGDSPPADSKASAPASDTAPTTGSGAKD